MANKLIPENLIGKVFQLGGTEAVVIEKLKPNKLIVDDYCLCEHDYPNGTKHLANIKAITSKGFTWYTFVLGKRIVGTMKFSDIEKAIAEVRPMVLKQYEHYKTKGY